MIIKFANNVNKVEAVRHVSNDVPKAVAYGADEPQRPSPEQLKTAADNINRAMQQANQNLEFEFTMDTDTKKTVVKVVDKQTGELVRQIPTEETLEIARSIDKFQRSLLLNQKA